MAGPCNAPPLQSWRPKNVLPYISATLFRRLHTHGFFFGVIMRYLCIHGHFYQPPRENPSLEAIELQDSAYPYHDWNERGAAECYAPNATSRILDNEQRIIKLVNNYGMMSFNFGPTLLSWLEAKAPRVYTALQEADQLRDRKSTRL